MIVDTPKIECYVKKSHLTGNPILTKDDELIFGILFAIRFVRNRSPLYIVYFPSIGAIYDKVNQHAIFCYNELNYEGEITLHDIGWWDALSSNYQLIELKYLKNAEVEMKTRTNKFMQGLYLFTCDPLEPLEGNDYGEAEIWHEHKTKNYFFDYETGALCCSPNNKMKVWQSSLSPKEKGDASFLKVYKETPEQMSHEDYLFLGDTESFDYK